MSTDTNWLAQVRPPDTWAERYRAEGTWRDTTPLADLRRWRDRTPQATAMIAHRPGEGPATSITYGEYAQAVERFAGALLELGVRPGQVVAMQLPNWWQLPALLLACARVGAVAAPIMPTIGARELERALAWLAADVCVTPARWAGTDYAGRVAAMAPRLPALRHHVVIADAVPAGAVDFHDHFERTAWEQRHPVALDHAADDPDRVYLVLFTSGTAGEPRAVLHSHNTLYAGFAAFVAEERVGADLITITPHAVSHIAGLLLCVFGPLQAGAATVLVEAWDPETGLDLTARHRATLLFGAPIFLEGVLAAQRRRPRELPALSMVMSGATTVPPQLVRDVAAVLGLRLHAIWGMTEVPGVTWTRTADPEDWACSSDGRPGAALEIDLRGYPDAPAGQPARLFVRGAGVCLATADRTGGGVEVVAERDDGWYDTGDLATPDGRGGMRIAGRVADRIGGAFMIPVADVEAELLEHPAVEDVALVGYPDGSGGELACAVVASSSGSGEPTLQALREHLLGRGMTEWYLPARLELVRQLPRNATGKVRKGTLREWLRT